MTNRAFVWKIFEKQLPANSIKIFIWNICIHIPGDYELTSVYGSLFTVTIYIYICISPYIICTITSYLGLQYLVLEHTLVTFMFELPNRFLTHCPLVALRHRYCSTLVWIAWWHQVRVWPVNRISSMANGAFLWKIISTRSCKYNIK